MFALFAQFEKALLKYGMWGEQFHIRPIHFTKTFLLEVHKSCFIFLYHSFRKLRKDDVEDDDDDDDYLKRVMVAL